MASCPSCQQSVDDDFGMVTCPHCGHVFLIDYQGEVQASQDEPTAGSQASGEEVLYTLHEGDDDTGLDDVVTSEDEGYDPPLESQEPLTDSMGVITGEIGQGDQLIVSANEEVDQLETKSFAEEISEFAESSGLPDGAYQYRLKIRVAGAQENIQNLRQAIEDLGLADLGLTSLGPDTVSVGWMGALSAHRLVHLIRALGLEVEWDQRHVLKESD